MAKSRQSREAGMGTMAVHISLLFLRWSSGAWTAAFTGTMDRDGSTDMAMVVFTPGRKDISIFGGNLAFLLSEENWKADTVMVLHLWGNNRSMRSSDMKATGYNTMDQ